MKTLELTWAQRRKLYFLTYGTASGAAGASVLDARQMLAPAEKQAKAIGWEQEDGEQPGAMSVKINPPALLETTRIDLPDILFEALKELGMSAPWNYGDMSDITLLQFLEILKTE